MWEKFLNLGIALGGGSLIATGVLGFKDHQQYEENGIPLDDVITMLFGVAFIVCAFVNETRSRSS